MKVFISYSRAERAVADRLVADLEARAFDVLIDRQDLPYGEEWQGQLGSLIRSCDTVVWLASATSVNSRWVKWELGEVQRINKRLIPIRISPLGPEELPEALGRIHILPAEGTYDPDRHLDTLVAAIETDRAWMEVHTRLADRATEWIARNRSPDRLLRGRALRDAEEWRDGKPERAPQPDGNTMDLLLQSRRAATRGLRRLVALAVLGFIAMAGLSVYAGLQAIEANRQAGIARENEVTATEQRKLAEERELEATTQRNAARTNEYRALSGLGQVALRDEDALAATELSLAAWPRTTDEPAPRFERVLANLSAASMLPIETARHVHKGAAFGALFGRDESAILSWSADGAIDLWNSKTGASLIPALAHTGAVTGAVYDAAQKRVLSWSADRSVRLWDAASGNPLAQPMLHDDAVRGAIFSPDETKILSWSNDRTARLWDAASGKPIGAPMVHGDWVSGASFSSDASEILTWSNDGTVRLWSADTAAEIRTIQHGDWVKGAMLFDNDRRLMSWSMDGIMRQWNIASGTQIGSDMDHRGAGLNGAIVTPDERHFISWTLGDRDGEYHVLRVWDAATGLQIGADMAQATSIEGATLSPDGSKMLSWNSRSLYLWDLATQTESVPHMEHEDYINGATFNADGTRLLSWSRDKTARLWDTASGQPIGMPLPHAGSVIGAAFSVDPGRLLSWSADGSVRLWDIATGSQLGSRQLADGFATSDKIDADDERIFSWSADGTAREWSTTLGTRSGKTGATGELEGVRFSPDGRAILTWTRDGPIDCWDAATGTRIGAPMIQASLEGVRFSDDGTRILSWSIDRTARLWDARTGLPIGEPMTHSNTVMGAIFSPQADRILTWSTDGTARLWNATDASPTGIVLPTLDNAPVDNAQFSADGRIVLLASMDNAVRKWDADTGDLLGAGMQHSGDMIWARFGAGDTRILSWSDQGLAALWDAESSAPIAPPMVSQAAFYNAIMNATGDRVLTMSSSQVRLWDANLGLQIGPTIIVPFVAGAKFNADDTELTLWSDKGYIYRWNIGWPKGDIIERACALLPRIDGAVDLSDVEAKYGINVGVGVCAPEQFAVPIDWASIERMPVQPAN